MPCGQMGLEGGQGSPPKIYIIYRWIGLARTGGKIWKGGRDLSVDCIEFHFIYIYFVNKNKPFI